MNAEHLRRVDPARNMHRFYRLDVQPDLSGGVLLVKEWGRIGAHGRMAAEPYDMKALATAALQRQAAAQSTGSEWRLRIMSRDSNCTTPGLRGGWRL
jgi:predicted DNA-binding WGR domain protein